MDQSELLSLLVSLSSLVVVVAVLIGLFTAITKFIAQYGMFIFAAGLAYLTFQGAGVDMAWVTNVLSNIASNATNLR